MAPRRRFERPTCRLGGGCSIQLSYRGSVIKLIAEYYISQFQSRQSDEQPKNDQNPGLQRAVLRRSVLCRYLCNKRHAKDSGSFLNVIT